MSLILFSLLLVIIFYTAAIIFIVLMAIEAATHKRFLWLFIILCFPLLGAIVYFFTEEKHDYVKVPPVRKTTRKRQ